jgi:hypothetical protein
MIAAGRSEGARMTKLLLKSGADLNATDNYGRDYEKQENGQVSGDFQRC